MSTPPGRPEGTRDTPAEVAEPLDPTEPAEPAEAGAAGTAGTDGPELPPPAPRSRYSLGSMPNMVRSLVVIGVLMAVLWFLVPRPSNDHVPAVDVHAVAVDVADRAGFPLEEAVDLPSGWTGRSARLVRSTAGVLTWHASWESPTGALIALEQAKGATDAWVTAQTGGGQRTGEMQAAGKTWIRVEKANRAHNSLVNVAATTDGVTTLLTGTASLEELASFAEHLRPVRR